MRLSQTGPAASKAAAVPRAAEDEAQQTAPQAAGESRALVAIAPPPAAQHETAGSYRPSAFLAHLIAMKDLHPQTRERRRAAPHEAIAAYRTTAALTHS
jgi:hypothetical protein